MSKKRKWLKEEEDLLISVYMEEGIEGVRKLDIDRTYTAMMSKLGKLGVKRCKEPKWSSEELELLTKYYSSNGAKGCIDMGVTKSYSEVCAKARYLKLRYLNDNWTDLEVDILMKAYPIVGIRKHLKIPVLERK